MHINLNNNKWKLAIQDNLNECKYLSAHIQSKTVGLKKNKINKF